MKFIGADPIVCRAEREDPRENVDITLPLVMVANKIEDRRKPVLDTALPEALVIPQRVGCCGRGKGVQCAEDKRAWRAEEEALCLVPHPDVLRLVRTGGEANK